MIGNLKLFGQLFGLHPIDVPTHESFVSILRFPLSHTREYVRILLRECYLNLTVSPYINVKGTCKISLTQ
jgi:hypothetical protein